MLQKLLLVVAAAAALSLAGCSYGATLHEPFIPILRQSEDWPKPDGSYSWSYETGNGIKAEEQGQLKQLGPKPEEAAAAAAAIASVRGSYSYQADDGTPVEISYTADENGFRPRGAAIPQPPEIPAAILRALEWIAQHPEEDNL